MPQPPNPWDVAPIPAQGDELASITQMHKGAATDAWEKAEVNLSHLFSVLKSGEPSHGTLSVSYGVPYSFKWRLDGLCAAGHAYFNDNDNQELQSDFADIVTLADNLSVRRNEIVHSITRPVAFSISNWEDEKSQHRSTSYRFFLVPPTYTSRKYDPDNQPRFMYTSVEIAAYREWFSFVAAAAHNLAFRLKSPGLPPFGRRHHAPGS